MEISEENIKIKIYIRNKGNLLANATVSLKTMDYGFLVIKGFKIWKSNQFNDRLQEWINIQPLATLAYGKYLKQVWIEDIKCWYELENKIYSAFIMARNNQKNKIESVNPDEIPV